MEDTQRFLERIQTSAARMDALIRDALNYSKAVRQELALSPVDLGALLRGMLDSYPELQPSKARIEIKGEIPAVMGNEAALTQCFSNLLGNAVKFVKPGEVPEIVIWAEKRDGATRGGHGGARTGASHLSPALFPQGRGESGWVRIWVEDEGIGIADSMLPRVFDMFSRGQSTYAGTGIGLALVRKVVECNLRKGAAADFGWSLKA
jgi:signal transduction histidine kinase